MQNEEFNFFEEQDLTKIQMGEMENLLKLLFDKRKEIEADEDLIKAKNAELDSLKQKVLSILDANGKKNFDSQYGKVYSQTKFQVSMPKDPNRAAALRAYFAKKGMEDVLTVNHMTLNAIFNSIVEEKETLGEAIDLKEILPGVDEPTARVVLAMKKGK